MVASEIFVTDSRLPSLNLAANLVSAQRAHGVSVARQTVEMVRLQRGRSALSAYEYHYYGLYRPDMSWDEKTSFMGKARTRALYLLANQFTWWDAAEDKLAFQSAMQAQGFPVPELYALAHPSRRFGGIANLIDSAAIETWLASAPAPLFGKPVKASHGLGAVLIAEIDRQSATFMTCGGGTHSLASLGDAIAPYVDSEGYIFQEALRPHAEVARLTGGRLATLRIVVLRGARGPEAQFIVVRLPSGSNRVDNFRRPGNLVGRVDGATGRVSAVTRGVGADRIQLAAHPDTALAFDDVRLPHVAEAVALALEGSSSFPGLHVQSWDVALTDEGPKILEMNPGGNFNLIQLTDDSGAWSPQLRDFARFCETLKYNPQVRGRALASKLAA